ncbi:MAG: ABC transporter ATP-binding protein [Flavobacteriaceae bacterium]
MVISKKKEIIRVMQNHSHKTVLEAKQLSIGYASKKGHTIVADAINFELKKGELIGLIGANGIGKSTLLKTLTKSLQKLSGEICINGKQLASITNIDLAKMLSVVLTENVSQTNLSVQELIALGRQPYTNWLGSLSEEDKLKTQQAIEAIDITDLSHKNCYELSDGQLQKVMLARALAQDTDLIILDEPTTHLDLYHKVSVLKLLQNLVRTTDKTILFSTHEINVTLSLCDKIIVMKETETIFGTPQELINKKAFDNLFPDDLVCFDAISGTFKIK